MLVRAWLAIATLAALQLIVLASPQSTNHAHHPHLRIVLKTKQGEPNGAPRGDATSNVHIDVHYAEPPAEELVEPSDGAGDPDAILYATPAGTDASTPTPLPVFFFHGATSDNRAGFNFQANVTAEGRAFVALSFCEALCSVSSLNAQVPLAIAQIRATVASDPRFAKGYIFIGHSQGATIARAVVEEMDDHKVRTLISLAGAQNGIFYGPQPSDAIPTQAFATRLGPKMIPSTLFDFTKYTSTDYAEGTFQADFNVLALTNVALQEKLSVLNLGRSPVAHAWRKTNTFLPVINNINPCEGTGKAACEAAKKRRRANFLKLTSAHFFGSPADDVIAPWQSALLGQYTDVATQQDLVQNFAVLEPMNMKLTDEYQHDTYGLKSLDAKGGLFLYDVPNVGHSCWVADSTPLGKTDTCRWQPVFENYLYPVLMSYGWGVV